MALSSNNNNNRDAVKGFVLIAVVIIGISTIVLHFIPNEEESTPEPIATPEPTTTFDPISKEEDVRLILAGYKTVDKPFRDLHNYCETVSNYNEYYEFEEFLEEIYPHFTKFSTYTDDLIEETTRLGLEDNTEIRNAKFSLSALYTVLALCIEEKVDRYGQ